jgi:cell division transport system ATP-binding protein
MKGDVLSQRRNPIEIIRFEQVSLLYPSRTPVFFNLHYSFYSSEFYFLTGVSGAGKTSLMKLIYRALKPTDGHVMVFGRDISTLSGNDLALFRQKMGLVFQDCRLLPHLTALDNVALSLRISGSEKRRARSYAKELLNWVGLSEYENHYPDTLSDGQKQRVAIARAVITRPILLIADEPTGNLDDRTAYKLMLLLEELNKIGTTIIVATHNRRLVESFPHPELHLQQGQLTTHHHQQENQQSQQQARYGS